MNLYLACVAVAFGILGVAWGRRSWPDVFIKVIFFGLALWGAFLLLERLGYLVKR